VLIVLFYRVHPVLEDHNPKYWNVTMGTAFSFSFPTPCRHILTFIQKQKFSDHELIVCNVFFSLLGVKVRNQIENFILENLFGEQPPSTAFIIKPEDCHLNYKHIAFLCLGRDPGNLSRDYAYTAMRGALLAIIEHNKKVSKKIVADDFIEFVAVLPFTVHSPSSDDEKKFVLFLFLCRSLTSFNFFSAFPISFFCFHPIHQKKIDTKFKSVRLIHV
jgi:hypothetical protein